MSAASPAGAVADGYPAVAGPGDLPRRMIALWASHDSDAFADLFVEDATMILPGVLCRGRAAIGEFMSTSFDGRYAGTRVTGAPIAMHSLGTDCVALITEGGVLHDAEQSLSAAEAIRASWIAVRDADTWRLAVYQNSPSE